MKFLKTLVYLSFCLTFFIACKNNSNTKFPNENIVYNEPDDEYDSDYREPYPEYCLLGKIPKVDPYSIKQQDGEVKTEGRTRADVSDIKINSFFATLKGNDGLKNAGISSITIDVKVGYGAPKITTGTFALEPFVSLSTEKKALPDVMVFLSDFDKSSTFEAVMPPDVELIKKSAFYTPDTYPSYIIEAARLDISHVEDVELDENEKEEQELLAENNMITGKQYVKGTISFTIKKFGPKGADFGPQTFTFASVSNWAYFP